MYIAWGFLLLVVLGLVMLAWRAFTRAKTWREYERKCKGFLANQGYGNIKLGTGTKDGGVDLTCTKNGKRYLVKCKFYKKPVQVKNIREFYAVVITKNRSGIFVTNSGYTAGARAFAKNRLVLYTYLG